MNTNKAMTTQTLFFILMLVLLSGTIYFGISKTSMLQKELSNQQERELKDSLEKQLDYCANPLNKGSKQRITINSKDFNSICLVTSREYREGVPLDSDEIQKQLREDLKQIQETQDNVVVLQTSFEKNPGSEPILVEYQIIDSFRTEYLPNIVTSCQFDTEDSKKIEFDLICE
jgi:hypothetical protein